MNIRVVIVAVALGLGVAATTTAQEAPSILKDIVKAAIEGYIRPAVTDLKKSTAALSQNVGALCRTRDSQALADTRAALAVVVSNWMRVEFLRFGPLSEQNRAARFLFWPDPRGTGLRQVQRALSTREPSLTNASDRSIMSAALEFDRGQLRPYLNNAARKPRLRIILACTDIC